MLNYKEPAFWIIIAAIAASVVAAICFLTSPKTTLDDELSLFLDGRICEHHYSEGHTDKHFVAVNHKVLGVGHPSDQTTVYLWVLYHEYSYENGKIQLKAGAHIPTVITAKRTDKHGHYELVEYWEPRDGEDYADDIREKFPWYLHGKALDSQRYIQEQLEFCDNAAKEYFSVSNVGDGDDSSNTVSSADVEPSKDSFDKDVAIASVLGEKYRAEEPDGLLHIQSCYLLANETVSGTPLQGNSGHMEKATFYLLVYHMKYSVNVGQLEEVDGGFVPTAITFAVSKNGEYTLEEYWTPRAGANYEKDIRAKFPKAAADDALNIEKYAESLKNDNRNQATEALNNLNKNN